MQVFQVWFSRLVAGVCLICLGGCGAPCPTPGGTEGVLHAGSHTLPDIQVRLYLAETQELVAFAVTRSDGSFALLKPDASAPVWLPAGRYKVTVESVGPVTLAFPNDYSNPQTSPLTVTWDSEQRWLDLDVPEPIVRH